MFIALSGIDGSGKTTQLGLLERSLASAYDVYCTKQPTDWFRQQTIVREFFESDTAAREQVAEELALLSAADRLRHSRLEISPGLSAGKVILCDRSLLCAYAAQLTHGVKELEWLISINRFAHPPDLAIYLDVPADIAFERICRRNGTGKARERNLNYLHELRAAYLSRQWEPDCLPRVEVVDGNQKAEVVADEIVSLALSALTECKDSQGVGIERQRGTSAVNGNRTG